MGNTTEQSSRFRRELIAYFAENKNMLNPNVTLQNDDQFIIFKQDAQANFYDIVAPLSYIINGGDAFVEAVLQADLTVDIDLGGLSKDDFYPAGTPLETLWRDMLTMVSISNFTFASWKSIVEVGSQVIPNKFTWDTTGDVGTVTVSDSDGNSQSATLPNEITVLWTYTKNDVTQVSWYLNTSIINYTLMFTTKWIYASYYGKTETPPPTIDANDPTRIIKEVTSDITVSPLTSNTEYGWIAVPATNPIYTKWIVNEFNKGAIVDYVTIVELIRYDGIIQIDGIDYHFYIYNYPSELLEPITLY